MSIRLDPRRLSTLRALAGEAGLRPGELVQRWIEERLDSHRATAGGDLTAPMLDAGALAALAARVDALAARLDAMTVVETPVADAPAPVTEPRRRGRPRKVAAAPTETTQATEGAPAKRAVKPRAVRATGKRATVRKRAKKRATRVALHDEIVAIIAEKGPQSAAELAAAIIERGRYVPPRSGKPLDAATVNGRVSNPTYRARFVRDGRRIGLATS